MVSRVSDEPLPTNVMAPQQSMGRDSQTGFMAQEPEAPGLMQLVTEPQSFGARMGTPSWRASYARSLVHALNFARSKKTQMNRT